MRRDAEVVLIQIENVVEREMFEYQPQTIQTLTDDKGGSQRQTNQLIFADTEQMSRVVSTKVAWSGEDKPPRLKLVTDF